MNPQNKTEVHFKVKKNQETGVPKKLKSKGIPIKGIGLWIKYN